MSPELTNRARRAVACPRWKWLPGMLAWRTTPKAEMVKVRMIEGLDGDVELADSRRSEVQPSGRYVLPSGHATVNGWHREESLLPDFTDPATIGCFAWLIADVHGGICVMEHRIHEPMKGWTVWQYDSDGSRRAIARAANRVEALVMALESAP